MMQPRYSIQPLNHGQTDCLDNPIFSVNECGTMPEKIFTFLQIDQGFLRKCLELKRVDDVLSNHISASFYKSAVTTCTG